MIRLVLLFAVLPSFLVAEEAPPAVAAEAPVEQILQPPEPGRFKKLFQPFRTDTAALSPDGKHLAYSVREGETLSVIIFEIAHPETIKARVHVIDDNAATPMLSSEQREKTPARIKWMRWVTPTRLVVETNHVYTRAVGADAIWQSWQGAVLGFDADGGNAKVLATPEDLIEYAEVTNSVNPFSVRRGNSTNFDKRANRPDEPTKSGSDFDPRDAWLPPITQTEETTTTLSTVNTGTAKPRTLRIFDLDPARAGAVTLVATGAPRETNSQSLSFYSLDVQTGKLTEQHSDFVLSTQDSMLDRQGRIRLTLPKTLLSSFPFRYDYLGPKGRNRPQPLDKATGLTGFSVSPDNYFGVRAVPLGFAEDPELFYYAANMGRDTYGIYSLNLSTQQRGKLAIENSVYDLIPPPTRGFPDQNSLVFDRFGHELIGVRYDNALRTTAWLRPQWQSLQSQFEKMFPGRSVELIDWDEPGQRFLVTTEGPADPGAFFLYDAGSKKLLEFVRRAPWVDTNHTHLTLPFSYMTQDGARVSGLVTVPQQPRLKPIPMVVLCPDLPWERVKSDFQTEVQALADMGFVVVQLNGRGAWGLGLKQRQSLTAGYDLVQVDDIATTVANLEKLFNVNPRRVALMGRGHGGFIALRALQAHPDKFRCAIALDAPVNLADWLAVQKWSDDDVQPHLTRAWLGDAARLKAAPLTSNPEAITKPILLINYPGPAGAARRPGYIQARNFASDVRKHGTTAEFLDLPTDYIRGLPAARAEVFDRIEEFLNVNVYSFNVRLPETKIIKETTP